MADLAANCSTNLPTSEVYFTDISVGEKVGVTISSAMCVAVVALFLEEVRFILKKYKTGRDNPELKIKSLWLLGIYPVFSTFALLAVFVPRAALLCDLASSVYLAVCLFHFTTLIILYAGGIPSLLDKVEDYSDGFILRTPPCCCCCVCCPLVRPAWSNLRKIRLMVFQNAFVMPCVSFISVLLWMDDHFIRGQVGADKPNLYLAILKVLSTGTAMYGLLILFYTSKGFLQQHSLKPKFFVMKVVLFLQNLQDFIFVSLAKGDLPPCSGLLSSNVRGDGVRHMVMIGEMFLLGLLARVLYRRPHTPSHLAATADHHLKDCGNHSNDNDNDLEAVAEFERVEEGGRGDRVGQA